MEKNIYKNRLLLLASFLDNLPKERFNYNHWVGADWGGKADLSCQTTACALGWATAIPALQDAGLMLLRREPGHGYAIVTLRKYAEDQNFPWLNVNESELACKEVFDLNRQEFEYLFIPIHQHDGAEKIWHTDEGFTWEDTNECAQAYGSNSPEMKASAKEVADHIRFFVSKKYPE